MRGKTALQSFSRNSSISEHIWFFLDEKNFCQDQMVCSQNNHWLTLFPQDVLILMKIKNPVHIMLFGGWSLVMVTFYLHSSSPMASDSSRRPTSSAWKKQYCFRSRGCCCRTLCLDSVLCHTSRRTRC